MEIDKLKNANVILFLKLLIFIIKQLQIFGIICFM